jgi:dual specificity protein phosphatase-like protein
MVCELLSVLLPRQSDLRTHCFIMRGFGGCTFIDGQRIGSSWTSNRSYVPYGSHSLFLGTMIAWHLLVTLMDAGEGAHARMDIFQIDDHGQLFISPDIDSWTPIEERAITAIFDLDEAVDAGIPVLYNRLLYIYFPFDDHELPDLEQLHALAQLGAQLIAQGQRVLVHCAMGHNRSALLAGVILTYLGVSGAEAVTRLRQRRHGALYNTHFATYLQTLPSAAQPLRESRPARARVSRLGTTHASRTARLTGGRIAS